MTKTVDQIIGQLIKEKEDVSVQLGTAGSLSNQFNILQDSVVPRELYTHVSTRGLGSSFVLGHQGLGWLGPENAGSVTAGSQPYLGDSRGTFAPVAVTSPENTFLEFFGGTRFKSGNTTANWDTGSNAAYFTSGQKLFTEAVYLGSELATVVKLSIAGSTTNNLNFAVSTNGTAYQSVSNQTTTSLTTAGSQLRVRMTEGSGQVTAITARVDSMKVLYTISGQVI